MKRSGWFVLVSLLVMAVMVFTGCSTGYSKREAAAADSYTAYSTTYDDYYDDYALDLMVETETEERELVSVMPTGQASSASTNEAPALSADAKLIYTADITIQTMAFDETLSMIDDMIRNAGGYIESRSMDNHSTYRTSYYTIRVPQGMYRVFIEQTSGLEKVTGFSENVRNVTAEYFDKEARLESAKAKLESLNELMRKAETMEDILTIQDAIFDCQYEIDYYSGCLRQYDDLVDYATIDMTVREVSEPVETPEPVIGFGAQLSQSFSQGINGFVSFFKGLILWLARSWEGLLIFALIVFGLVMLIRRWVKKAKDAAERRRENSMQHAFYPYPPQNAMMPMEASEIPGDDKNMNITEDQ